MDLGEHIHGLNLLCGTNLSNAELRIAMCEVNTEYLNDPCKPKSLEAQQFPITQLMVNTQ